MGLCRHKLSNVPLGQQETKTCNDFAYRKMALRWVEEGQTKINHFNLVLKQIFPPPQN